MRFNLRNRSGGEGMNVGIAGFRSLASVSSSASWSTNTTLTSCSGIVYFRQYSWTLAVASRHRTGSPLEAVDNYKSSLV